MQLLNQSTNVSARNISSPTKRGNFPNGIKANSKTLIPFIVYDICNFIAECRRQDPAITDSKLAQKLVENFYCKSDENAYFCDSTVRLGFRNKRDKVFSHQISDTGIIIFILSNIAISGHEHATSSNTEVMKALEKANNGNYLYISNRLQEYTVIATQNNNITMIRIEETNLKYFGSTILCDFNMKDLCPTDNKMINHVIYSNCEEGEKTQKDICDKLVKYFLSIKLEPKDTIYLQTEYNGKWREIITNNPLDIANEIAQKINLRFIHYLRIIIYTDKENHIQNILMAQIMKQFEQLGTEVSKIEDFKKLTKANQSTICSEHNRINNEQLKIIAKLTVSYKCGNFDDFNTLRQDLRNDFMALTAFNQSQIEYEYKGYIASCEISLKELFQLIELHEPIECNPKFVLLNNKYQEKAMYYQDQFTINQMMLTGQISIQMQQKGISPSEYINFKYLSQINQHKLNNDFMKHKKKQWQHLDTYFTSINNNTFISDKDHNRLDAKSKIALAYYEQIKLYNNGQACIVTVIPVHPKDYQQQQAEETLLIRRKNREDINALNALNALNANLKFSYNKVKCNFSYSVISSYLKQNNLYRGGIKNNHNPLWGMMVLPNKLAIQAALPIGLGTGNLDLPSIKMSISDGRISENQKAWGFKCKKNKIKDWVIFNNGDIVRDKFKKRGSVRTNELTLRALIEHLKKHQEEPTTYLETYKSLIVPAYIVTEIVALPLDTWDNSVEAIFISLITDTDSFFPLSNFNSRDEVMEYINSKLDSAFLRALVRMSEKANKPLIALYKNERLKLQFVPITCWS